jgi:hypothetical protein
MMTTETRDPGRIIDPSLGPLRQYGSDNVEDIPFLLDQVDKIVVTVFVGSAE